MRLRDILTEGGNQIPNAKDVPLDQVQSVVDTAIKLLPPILRINLAKDIGSAGFKKVPPGDIDLMIESDDLIKHLLPLHRHKHIYLKLETEQPMQ